MATYTVGDLIRHKELQELVAVGPAATVLEAVEAMSGREVGAVLIRGAGGAVEGIFTERDVLKRVATVEMDQDKTPVKQVMTTPLVTMARNALVGDVLAEMSRRDIRNMPVKDEANQVVGLITMPWILQYAQAFNIDEQVRRSWQEVAKALDNDDQYTPG